MATATEDDDKAYTIRPPIRHSTTETLVGDFPSIYPPRASSKLEPICLERRGLILDRVSSPCDTASTQPRARKHLPFAQPLDCRHDHDPLIRPSTTMSSDNRKPDPSRSGTIDEDFDFSNRKTAYKTTRFSGIQRKLQTKKSTLLGRSVSAPTTPQETTNPARANSIDSNSTKSISSNLAMLLGTAANLPATPRVPTVQFAESASLPATPLESLPNDRTDLEGLINIHLSKLDRYRRQVNDFNTVITNLQDDLRKLIDTPEARAVPQLVTALQMEIQQTREGRDSKRVYVGFHMGELRQIAEKRMLLDEEMGVPPSLPLVFEMLEGEEVWEQRFW